MIQKMFFYNSLSPSNKVLIDTALNGLDKSYAPYSRFLVCAALEVEDGRIFTGNNVENASYGLSICAERAAVCRAISEGCRKFKTIGIATKHMDYKIMEPSMPCGACLQFLSEFGGLDIIVSNERKTNLFLARLEEILAMPFLPVTGIPNLQLPPVIKGDMRRCGTQYEHTSPLNSEPRPPLYLKGVDGCL